MHNVISALTARTQLGQIIRRSSKNNERFLVERRANVEIVSACSGHGFKFASAIGEIVAERVTSGSGRQPPLEIPGTRSS